MDPNFDFSNLSPEQQAQVMKLIEELKSAHQTIKELRKRSPPPTQLRIVACGIGRFAHNKSVSALTPDDVKRWRSRGHFSLAANAALIKLVLSFTTRDIPPCTTARELNEWLEVVKTFSLDRGKGKKAPLAGLFPKIDENQAFSEKNFTGSLTSLLQKAINDESIAIHQHAVYRGSIDTCFVLPQYLGNVLMYYPTAFVEVSLDKLDKKRAQSLGYAALLLETQNWPGTPPENEVFSPIVGIIFTPNGFEVHAYSRTFLCIREKGEEERNEQSPPEREVGESLVEDEDQHNEESEESEEINDEENEESESPRPKKRKLNESEGKVIDVLLFQLTLKDDAVFPWSNLVHMLREWNVEIRHHLNKCFASPDSSSASSSASPFSPNPSKAMTLSLERFFFSESSNVAFVVDFDNLPQRCLHVWKVYDRRGKTHHERHRNWTMYLEPDDPAEHAERRATGLLTLPKEALEEPLKNLHILRCPFIDGSHVPVYAHDFLPILLQLQFLHKRGIVHGDIRLYNMLFVSSSSAAGGEIQRTTLIDFDFSGQVGTQKYPRGFNTKISDGQRHPGAVAGNSLEFVHDCFSLKAVMDLFHTMKAEHVGFWQSMRDSVEKGSIQVAIDAFTTRNRETDDIVISSDPGWDKSLFTAKPVNGMGSLKLI